MVQVFMGLGLFAVAIRAGLRIGRSITVFILHAPVLHV